MKKLSYESAAEPAAGPAAEPEASPTAEPSAELPSEPSAEPPAEPTILTDMRLLLRHVHDASQREVSISRDHLREIVNCLGQFFKDTTEFRKLHGAPLRIGNVVIALRDPKATPIPEELREVAGQLLRTHLKARKKATVESLRQSRAQEDTKVRASLEIMEGMDVFDFLASYPLPIGEEKRLKIFEGRGSVAIRIDTIQLLTDFDSQKSGSYSFIVNFTDLELGNSCSRIWKLEFLRKIMTSTFLASRSRRPQPSLPPEEEGKWRALFHQNGRGIVSHFFANKRAFCSVSYEYSTNQALEELTIPRKDGDHRCAMCLRAGAPAPTPPCDCRKCLLDYHDKKASEALKLEKKNRARPR